MILCLQILPKLGIILCRGWVCVDQVGWVKANISIHLLLAGWENSNLPPTHQSVNLAYWFQFGGLGGLGELTLFF